MIMSAGIQKGAELTFDNPVFLFEGQYLRGREGDGGNYDVSLDGQRFLMDYDVSLDGQRFLMVEEADPSASIQVNVVSNWFEELRRLARFSHRPPFEWSRQPEKL